MSIKSFAESNGKLYDRFRRMDLTLKRRLCSKDLSFYMKHVLCPRPAHVYENFYQDPLIPDHVRAAIAVHGGLDTVHFIANDLYMPALFGYKNIDKIPFHTGLGEVIKRSYREQTPYRARL